MPSVVDNYEYDIFISYRQNDNASGWVTEFVRCLNEELAATIKEHVLIYFDANPHDGLLETHNVNKSLEGRLKCLIFIPILSQTYCDNKSFAWQHEFRAFNQMAKQDHFGGYVTLPNGNVACRILPVKIHDLDADDKTAIEEELGDVLRAIEFIYKEPGVNRPLKPADDKKDNKNKTDYQNQLNKVANAVKELLHALKVGPVVREKVSSPRPHAQQTSVKSIAVLPLVNMSNDPNEEYFSNGVTEEILNYLAPLKGLKVTGRTSSFQFKNKNPDLREVGRLLGVQFILEGSIRRQGEMVRITIQLINADDGFHVWSERYDRKLTDIFAVQDEIAQVIA